MKIGIIGAGSIGLLFAAYLSKTSHVSIYTKTSEQAEAINKNGVVLVKKDGKSNYSIKACSFDLWNGQEDLTIVAVKQYKVKEIIERAAKFSRKPLNILFLQNGMSHLKLLSQLEGNNLFVGSIEHGAYKENPFTVRHNGEGVTNLAVFSGDSTSLTSFSSLVPDDFPVSIHNNYYEMLIGKLIINAVINPLTAILQVQNGLLIKNDYYYEVLKDLFAEIRFILNLTDSNVYFLRVIEVCNNTALNRSSMLKDIEMGRKTEIDAILGFLLEEAQKQEKQAPMIKSLYLLIKGKESNKQQE
ncbi:MAG: 2-dehydropantoate 2-reductase [Bacillota bacterium]|nr:2-dehydropantoate 2-reductase [Bacillota bacterium]